MGPLPGHESVIPDNPVSPPVNSSAGRKVVLATFGTLGDLHPFIAVALRLRSAGFEPVIATDSSYRRKVESVGIAFHRLRPEQEAIERDLGMTRASMVRKVVQRPDYVLRKFLLPYLHESYEDSLAVLHDAAFVLTHTTALATKVAAEKLGVPHIAAVLQPMAMLSVFDPSALAPMPGLMRWIHGRGPRAAAIVHHGGVGTTAQALRSGRPQLIVPYLVDQPDNAARVQRLGAGIAVPLRKYRSAHVAIELRQLLEDRSIATRADAVARTIANEDGPGAAVQVISALLARPRLPAPATTASWQRRALST